MSNQEFIEISFELPHQFVDAVSHFISENISSGLVYEKTDKYTVTIFYVPSDDKDNYAEKLQFYFQSLTEYSLIFKR